MTKEEMESRADQGTVGLSRSELLSHVFLTSFHSLDILLSVTQRSRPQCMNLSPGDRRQSCFALLLGLNAPCQVRQAGILRQNPGLIALSQHLVSRVRN